MKRFDRSIKVLQDEIFRVIGKVATEAVSNRQDPSYSTNVLVVRCLKEAIEVLKNHERNKYV